MVFEMMPRKSNELNEHRECFTISVRAL